jgi:hypothetical protein
MKHYEFVWKRSTVYDETEILNELPRTLRSEVALHVHDPVIQSVRFLRELDTCEVRGRVLKVWEHGLFTSASSNLISGMQRSSFAYWDGPLTPRPGAAQISPITGN